MFSSSRFLLARASLLVIVSVVSAPALALPLPGPPADYVIVTPARLAREFQRFADAKTRTGVPARVKTLESIRTEYPAGRDDAERVRLFLQDARAQWNTRWVLLGGLPPDVPARRVHSDDPIGPQDFVTDLYFSALDGDWDADQDGIYAEPAGPSSSGDQADLVPDVFVGRAPVRSAREVRDFVQKNLLAARNAAAPTTPRAIITADVLIPSPWFPPEPISADMAPGAEFSSAAVFATPGMVAERLYQNWDDPRWPAARPLDRASLLAALHEGADFLGAIGRGWTHEITAGNDLVDLADIDGLAGSQRPVSAWLTGARAGDFQEDCLAAHFVRGASGGAVTCVASSRVGFFTPNLELYREFTAQALAAPSRPVGEALAIARAAMSSVFPGSFGTWAVMEVNLFGDPQARIRATETRPVAAGSAVPDARIGPRRIAGDEAADLTTARPQASEGPLARAVRAEPGAQALAPPDFRAAGEFRFDAVAPDAAGTVGLSGAVPGTAGLDLYDVGGRRMRSFAIEAGRFDVSWDLRDASGRRAPAGLYFARLRSAAGTLVRRVVVH